MMGDLDPEPPDLGNGRGRVAETVEQDIGAGLGQHLGYSQADAAGGTGDQCGLAFERHAFLLHTMPVA